MTTTVTTPSLSTAGPGAASKRIGRLRQIVAFTVPPTAVFGLVVGAWYAASYLMLAPRRRFLLPPPDQVLRVGFGERDNRAELLTALGLSAQVALLGLVIATAVGVAAGVVMSQARWLEHSLFPYAVLLQTIPILALVPLFGFWFGFGLTSRVLVCVLIALFPIIANTLFGLRSAERGHHDLFTLHDASRWTRLVKLQLPAAMPAVFTGLRISAGLSVIGAIVGDYFFRQGQPGIGRLIDVYRNRLESEQMLAAVILASLFGIAVFLVFTWLGRRVATWHESAHGHHP